MARPFALGWIWPKSLTADQDELSALHERLFTTIERARKPIVAAVHGAALAAGTGLAANAHIVIASKDARFGLTEIRIGLWPMVVFRAVTRANPGERRATELSITGRINDAAEALQFSLVTEIADDPKTKATELALKLAAYSPVAIATGLEHIARTRSLAWANWDAAAPINLEMRSKLMASHDFKEGVSAFLEKRPPQWPSLKS